MKPQTRFCITAAVIVVVLGVALFVFSAQLSEPLTIFSATINRDCAPWDGAAFTVSIPYDTVSVIMISIWRSPDFKIPRTFSLPNEASQVGSAYRVSQLDPLIPLKGEVSFQRVGETGPIEGRFRLRSERGETFAGKFIAEWGERMALCG
jgi:hypothetical protein